MAAVSNQHIPPTPPLRAPPASSSTSMSALDTFIRSTETSVLERNAQLSPSQPGSSTHPSHLTQLAAQILHNLQYQHDWTSLAIHTHRPRPRSSRSSSSTASSLLPRPLISGLPPHRLYIHPDEQVELIRAKEERRKARQQQRQSRQRPQAREEAKVDGGTGDAQRTDSSTPSRQSEPRDDSDEEVDGDETDEDSEGEQRREWVLPSHIQEKWSLRRFAEIFDAIETVPPSDPIPTGSGNEESVGVEGVPLAAAVDGLSFDETTASSRDPKSQGGISTQHPKEAEAAGNQPASQSVDPTQERNLKRVLLGTVNDDSTIVYYILHDGLVKPRQN